MPSHHCASRAQSNSISVRQNVTGPGVSETIWPDDDLLSASQIRVPGEAVFPSRLAGLGRPDHVALTFDDGPDPASTPAFLDLLAARHLHATFFLLGSMVAEALG